MVFSKKTARVGILFLLTLSLLLCLFACDSDSDDSEQAVECTEHIFGDWTTVTPATCMSAGKKERTCTVCGEKQEEDLSALGHEVVHHVAQAATCTAIGWDAYDTCSRCNYTTYEEISALGHAIVHHTAQAATCTAVGWNAYDTCSHCDYTTYEEIPATGHKYEEGICLVCRAEEPRYTRIDVSGEKNDEGEYLLFGKYPQTDVTSTLGDTLNEQTGVTPLPTDSNSQNWTSYDYYINYSQSLNFMWYIDLKYEGEKYRGVYFTSYRPSFTGENNSSTDNGYQDDYGYETSTVYWFRYDPIKWRILSEENGKTLILCEMIIDGQDYYYNDDHGSTRERTAVENYNDEYYAENGIVLDEYVYENNYQYSTIRKWLNETFYNTAFTSLQKALIQTTTVDNSARSTNPNNNETEFNSGNNQYACSNTEDKIFLLSMQEVTNSAYGFSSDREEYDTARKKQTTEYAQCQGAWTDKDTGIGYWWLRSPYYGDHNYPVLVNSSGYAPFPQGTYYTDSGVVPALTIQLQY